LIFIKPSSSYHGHQVDTYHLIVGIGESTVVCLRESSVRIGQNLPALQTLVFIDGGLLSWFRNSGASHIIQTFILNLGNFYFLPPDRYPGGTALMDSVVITHWDQDHSVDDE
jgi:hypothetical protein